MYTWGYVKSAALAKLDLTEDEANVQNLINRFPIYANEVITQVCSAVKPKYTYAHFNVYDNDIAAWNELKRKYDVYLSEDKPIAKPSTITNIEANFWSEYDAHKNVGDLVNMPSDFVSFGDDVCYQLVEKLFDFDDRIIEKHELHDDDFEYVGYNQVLFKHTGNFYISYNARWYMFTQTLQDNTTLDIPTDILDCIPSYIASQCYKIDDEYKASVFRNEYEIMLSRIDNTNFKTTKTLTIGGDW